MKAFLVTTVDAMRLNQTVRHVYTDPVAYTDVQQGTWNRLDREFGVERDADVDVRRPACGMDISRIPKETEVVSVDRLAALYESDAVCGRCYTIVNDQ